MRHMDRFKLSSTGLIGTRPGAAGTGGELQIFVDTLTAGTVGTGNEQHRCVFARLPGTLPGRAGTKEGDKDRIGRFAVRFADRFAASLAAEIPSADAGGEQ